MANNGQCEGCKNQSYLSDGVLCDRCLAAELFPSDGSWAEPVDK